MLPSALLPRFGSTWAAQDDTHITVHSRIGITPIDVELTIDAAGLLRSVVLQRWGDVDKAGTWGWHPFGGEIIAHRTFGGLTVPRAGRLGWNVGNDGWRAASSSGSRRRRSMSRSSMGASTDRSHHQAGRLRDPGRRGASLKVRPS